MTEHPSFGPARLAFFFAATAVASIVVLLMFALSGNSGARALDPDRPFRAYAPGISSDANAPSPSPSPSPGPGSSELVPHLDAARAVSKLVTYEAGGVLTATAADGSRYTLTIPVHAVPTDETVVMTPVSSLDGLVASGGLRAGVQIEPDGLQLVKAATLVINPASPVSPREEITFTTSEGEPPYAQGLDVGTPETRFTLWHFSGWYIAGGSDLDRAYFIEDKGGAAAGRLAAEASEISRRQRERQELDPSASTADWMWEMSEFLDAAYRDFVIPAMDAGDELARLGDVDSVYEVIDLLNDWLRQQALLVSTPEPGSQEWLRQQDLIGRRNTLWSLMIENARKRCVEKHELEMIDRLLVFGRWGFVNGIVDDSYMRYVSECARFELDFETTLVAGGGGATAWSFQLKVTALPIHAGAPRNLPSPQALEILEVDSPLPNCTFNGSAIVPDKPFIVSDLTWDKEWNSHRRVRRVVAINDIRLTMTMGDLAGTATWNCRPPGRPFTGPFPGGVEGFFNAGHIAESGPNGVTISRWEMQRGTRGNVIAVKSYSQTTFFVTERSVFTLRHTPGE